MSDEIRRLVAALDEDPDPLHGDRTPAAHALVGHGLAALPAVFDVLEGEDAEITRLRAQRVLEGVSRAWVAERTPTRPLARADLRAWEALWRENGPYDWRAPAPERAAAVANWRAWLERQRR